MNILETRNLKKYYGQGEAMVRALDGVDLAIEKGEFAAIVGTSGSGKSTLLHMLGGLDRPTAGTVVVDGNEIFKMKDEALTIFRRRKIGFVFQNYNLVPVLNVYENIVLPVQLDGGQIDEAYVNEIIATLGLKEKLNNLPGNLSGGQQQRVAIARALAAKPAIILADEPTGNLDSRTTQDVMGLLKITSQKFKQTMVVITHNEEIAQMADRIIRIEDGRITSDSAAAARRGEGNMERQAGRTGQVRGDRVGQGRVDQAQASQTQASQAGQGQAEQASQEQVDRAQVDQAQAGQVQEGQTQAGQAGGGRRD